MRIFWLALFINFAQAQTLTQAQSPAAAHSPIPSQSPGIAAFSIWAPKDAQRFEAGYKQHLQWHKTSGDKWDWYGWLVISGRHVGQFIDATFGHSWNDLSRPVDPAGDGADNNLHTEPFGDYLTGFKVARIEEASVADTDGLKTRYSRLITLKTDDLPRARSVLLRLKERYTGKDGIRNFQCFHTIDGGDLNQVILLIGLNDLTQFDRSQNIAADVADIQRSLNVSAITEINSELLLYKKEMSLFARER
jgi:hypothetical protein